MEMLDLRKFKAMIISYGTNSPFVKQMLKSRSTYSRIILYDWKNWSQQYQNLVLNCSHACGKMELGQLNSEVGLEVLKFPKINFFEKGIMLMNKGSLYIMTAP